MNVSRLRGTIYFLMSAEFAVACIIQEYFFRNIGCHETAGGIRGSKVVRENNERSRRARLRESENAVVPSVLKIAKIFKQSVRPQKEQGNLREWEEEKTAAQHCAFCWLVTIIYAGNSLT